jgi:hypothetical protein
MKEIRDDRMADGVSALGQLPGETGVTARAALGELREAGPRRLVFAAPVCARETQAALRAEASDS